MAGNLFLIGLMGAGKTTLGRQLADYLQYPFYDSDNVICQRTGVNIPTIFEIEGEQGFRQRESMVIQELTAMDNVVLVQCCVKKIGIVFETVARLFICMFCLKFYLNARNMIKTAHCFK